MVSADGSSAVGGSDVARALLSRGYDVEIIEAARVRLETDATNDISRGGTGFDQPAGKEGLIGEPVLQPVSATCRFSSTKPFKRRIAHERKRIQVERAVHI